MTTLPFIVGHRGAAGLAPENTLASIRRAALEGATWVEFDVKLAACGTPVLLHDDTLERTTNGEGAARDVDAAVMATLDAGGWFADEFAGEPVPTLADTIECLGDLALGANIEIKPSPGTGADTAQAVADEILRSWPKTTELPVISSYDMEVMAVIRDRLPDIERALLFYQLPEDWMTQVEKFRASAIHLSNTHISAPDVEAIRNVGLPVRVYTVNDPIRATELLSWGVTSVFTDRPDLIAD